METKKKKKKKQQFGFVKCETPEHNGNVRDHCDCHHARGAGDDESSSDENTPWKIPFERVQYVWDLRPDIKLRQQGAKD